MYNRIHWQYENNLQLRLTELIYCPSIDGEENSTLDLKGKSHREIKDLIEQFYPQIQADLLPDYN